MAILQELARIERVEDLRKVWQDEAADFTPWLADNVSLLGEAIGVEDLELRGQEVSVGSYSLDILAHDVGNDRPVVIENQLETTDHIHLGQLLTYAAGFDAKVMVWIAKKFKDEHREALDLLNHRTGQDTEFFGIEVELWKIGDSPPAPNFNLVAFPNEWRKQTGGANPKTNSELAERYRDFYSELTDKLVNVRYSEPRAAPANNVMVFGSGYTAFKYRAYISIQRARIAVYIDSSNYEWNKSLFDQMEEDKAEIEAEVGTSLEWDRNDNKRVSLISTVKSGGIQEEQEILSGTQDWMVEWLLKFKEVFGPRLAELVD